MRQHAALLVDIALLVALSLSFGATGRLAAQTGPTFNTDIAPILYENCVRCHRSNQAAPMSLLTFSDVRPWARAIKTKVLAGEMPPWAADPRFGSFSNQPRLTPEQRRSIVAWVDGGAPQGDGEPPSPPVFDEGWTLQMGRPPDVVLEAPSEVQVPANGDVPVFTVWLKPPFRFDRFVEAMELRPSNPRIVHHASVSAGTLPPRTRLGEAALWAGGPLLDGVRLSRDGTPYMTTSNVEFGYPLLFYVAGGGFLRLPPGYAKRIRAGEYLSWGMHAVTTGTPERTRMRLALWFAKTAVTHEVVTMTANVRKVVNGREVTVNEKGRSAIPRIPPFAADWRISGSIMFPTSATLHALWPHMHLRGKDMTFVLTYPDGREEVVLRVPKYNMHWQTTYILARPIAMPAGSTITATGTYDNSAANRHNPDPASEVLWGEQSWNEMFNPFLEVSVDADDLRFERLLEQIR